MQFTSKFEVGYSVIWSFRLDLIYQNRPDLQITHIIFTTSDNNPGSLSKLLPLAGASGTIDMKVQKRSFPMYYNWIGIKIWYWCWWCSWWWWRCQTLRVLMAIICRTPWGDRSLFHSATWRKWDLSLGEWNFSHGEQEQTFQINVFIWLLIAGVLTGSAPAKLAGIPGIVVPNL